MAEKKESAEATVWSIRRVTRKKYSAEEKGRIVLEGLRGETSIGDLCRREGIPSNLYSRRTPDGVTDQGVEYRGAFDRVCAEKQIRQTRTRPRHAWTNGFVERLQGTILTELWRTPALHRTACGASVEFRRRFFTSAAAMQTALDRYLDFYNHRRSHQGYRTQGRTPGQIFFTRKPRHDRLYRRRSVNTSPLAIQDNEMGEVVSQVQSDEEGAIVNHGRFLVLWTFECA